MTNRLTRIVIIVIIALVSVDLIFLNWWVFFHLKKSDKEVVFEKKTNLSCDFSCPQSCVKAIESATSSATLQASQAPQPAITQIIAESQEGQLKEYIINFGASVWTSSDWQSVPDLIKSINPALYGKIKNIYFEVVAHLSNENTSASIRLFNNSDKQVVAGSEVNFNSMKCQPGASAPISLEAVSKEYQVQVKGTENATVYIDAARLRIVTQ